MRYTVGKPDSAYFSALESTAEKWKLSPSLMAFLSQADISVIRGAL